MATFSNNESNLSVRNKINAVLQHSDGTASELVINEAGADVDFRVESDTSANAFFVDGATGNVGINTAPVGSARLTVSGDIQTAAGSGGAITAFETDPVRLNRIISAADAFGAYINATFGSGGSAALRFQTANVEHMRIDAAGNVGVGIAFPVNRLHVSLTPPVTVPAAGANGHAFAVGANPYGLAAGVLDSGTSYLQSTRFDGTATNYDLLIQPNGGKVGIGTSTTGASKLRISGLPTSSAGLAAGDVWNDSGTLKIA